MRNICKNIRLLFAACILTACSPARTGVIENTLTTNQKPSISITGQNSLIVKAHGVLRPEVETDRATVREMAVFNYAFFADAPSARNAPDNRFAYAAIVRLSTPGAWRFHPPSKMNGAFSAKNVTLGDFQFFEQLLRVSSEGDWGSEVWRKNGGTVPRQWLAKRWITHLNDDVRAVMEYREEWPAAMDAVSGDLIIIGGNAGKALSDFVKRADDAFNVTKKRGDFKNARVPASQFDVSGAMPNITKLVGEVTSTANS